MLHIYGYSQGRLFFITETDARPARLLSMPPKTCLYRKKECIGTGGVLDSLLDIVGQCTLSKAGMASALLAGCGVVDAQTIRSNCCTLISILVALLAVGHKTSSRKTDLSGEESTKNSIYNERYVLPYTFKDDRGEFLSMGANPSPDSVALVQKKGWAARQYIPPSTGAKTGVNRSRGPEYDSAKTHRAHRSVGNSPPNRIPLRPATMARMPSGTKYFAKGLRTQPVQKAGLISPVKKTSEDRSRTVSVLAISTEGRDRARSRKKSKNVANEDVPSGKCNIGQVDAQSSQSRPLVLPVPDFVASPPRLSRMKMSGIPALQSSTDRFPPTCEAAEGGVALGLAVPTLGKRKIVSKVSKQKKCAALSN